MGPHDPSLESHPEDPPVFTGDEALAFIESLRLTLAGKTGFVWLATKLERLATYVARLTEESERMRAFIEAKGLTDEYRGLDAPHGSEGASR